MTEEDLIRKCLGGNTVAQRQLFEQFAPRMMTVCRRYASRQQQAEDMLQEAFIRVFSKLHQYRFEGSLEGWIRRIVVRVAIRHVEQTPRFFDEIDADNVAANVDVINDINEEDLLELIQQLPPGYRTVFNLFVIDGYSHEEIARLLNIASVTSRTQLSKARKILQQRILLLYKAPRYER